MSTDLERAFAELLAANNEGAAAHEYVGRLGPDGLERLLKQTEADYAQAAGSLDLSGRDAARIAAVAQVLARAAGIDTPDGRATVAQLVAVGWMMAVWYGRS